MLTLFGLLRAKIMLMPWYTLLTVLSVDLLATSGDMHSTWTSPIIPKLKSNDTDINPLGRPITEDESSWITSLISIGAIFGPFIFGFIAEKFGRKPALLSIAIPHIIAYLTLAFAQTIELYYFARLLAGISIGGGYNLLPMYVSEVAEDSNRGLLSTTLNIFWTFGNLVPYALGPYIPILWFNVAIACIPALFFVSFLIIAPESPHYLIAKNKTSEAEKALMKLRSYDSSVVSNEIRHIKDEIQENSDNITIIEFFKTRIYLKALIISLVIIISQQTSGINAVLFNAESIFKDAGANGLSPEISALIIGIVIFGSSFFTPFVSDRWGRKILMNASLLGLSISLFAFGIYFYLKDSTSVNVSGITWLPLCSLIVYIIMFNLGLGPLAWTISSELFPTSVKTYSSTIISSTSWFGSFIVTRFFNDLRDGLGDGPTYWLFGVCCFATFIFIIFFVPETKEKSFQEIQEILREHTVHIYSKRHEAMDSAVRNS